MRASVTRREPQNGASTVTKKQAVRDADKRTKRSTKPASKRRASASGAKKPSAVQQRPARKAYSYAEREAVVEAGIKSLGGSAVLNELFEEIGTDDDGQFATPRRIAATVRAQRGDGARVQNVGGVYSLVKRSRKVAAKSNAKRQRKASRKS